MKLDQLNHAQRAVVARALYIRRARLPQETVKKIVEVR